MVHQSNAADIADSADRSGKASDYATPSSTVYAVTGASGQLGRRAVEELLTRGIPAHNVVALVRTPAKAAALAEQGVAVRKIEYSDPKSLSTALAGVDRLLLVSSSESGQRVAHHSNVIKAAEAAHVSRIVYTGILNVEDTTNPLANEHQYTESALRESGVPFTVLRNGWYSENFTYQMRKYVDTGEIVGSAGNGRVSAAARGDYAAAGAAALVESDSGRTNRIYELGGPAFDLPTLAQTISEVTGARVTYRDLPVPEYTSWLQSDGLDEATAAFVAALDESIAHGDLETRSQDLAKLIGRATTPLADVVRAAYEASGA